MEKLEMLRMIKKIFDYGYEEVLQEIYDSYISKVNQDKIQYELMEEVKASMKAVDES